MKNASKGINWLGLILICFGSGTIFCLPYLQFTFYDAIKNAFGFTDTQLGNTMTVMGIISLFGYAGGGVIADKINARYLLTFCIVGTGLAGVWYAMFPPYPIAMLVQALMGLCALSVFWPSMMKALKYMSPPDQQSKLFGYREAGHGFAGWLVQQATITLIFNQIQDPTQGIKYTILALSAVSIVVGVLAFIFLPNTPKAENPEGKDADTSVMKGLVYSVRQPLVWLIGITLFGIQTSFGAVASKFAIYLTDIVGVDNSLVVSLLNIRSTLLSFAVCAVAGIIATKWGKPIGFLALSYFGAIVCFGLLIVCPPVNQFAMIVLVFLASSFLLCARVVYYVPVGLAGIPDQYYGTAMGLICVIGFSTDAFMYTVFGMILDSYSVVQGMKIIFSIGTGVLAVGLVATLVMQKMIKKKQVSQTNGD